MDETEELIKQATIAPPARQVELYLQIANSYFPQSETRSIEYATRALDLADRYHDQHGKTQALIELGKLHSNFQHNTESLEYYQQSLLYIEESGELSVKAEVLQQIGNIHYKLGEFSKALDYYFRSLRILEDLDDKNSIAHVSNSIGRGYIATGNNEKALEYFMNSLHLIESSGDEKGIANVSNNIGIIYQKKGEYDKALKFYQRSLKIQEDIGNKRGIASVINNIGIIYSSMGYKKKALQYFFDSLVLKKEIGDQKSISNSYSNIGQTYLELKDFDKALEALTLGLNLAIETEAKDLQRQTHQCMADLFKAIGDTLMDSGEYLQAAEKYRTCIEHSQKFEDLQIDLYKEAYNKQIADIQARFETDKRVREAEIFRLKNIELAEANATKDKFFTIIAHDVKNPLNSLLMSVEYLSMQLDQFEPDKIKKLVSIMNNEIKSITELFDNLMQWSGSQTGKMQFKPIKVSLIQIVENAMKHLEAVASYKGIEIVVSVPENLEAHVDENMIMTVLRNLVTNAVKFSYKDSKVVVSAEEMDDHLRVKVSDQGVGIESENLKKLFRIDSHLTTKGTACETGTGLGLIVCKEFIEKNGGQIHVESIVGKGSDFIFTLPKT